MAGHLDPDVLADFREGLLGRRRSARIRAHLRTCPTCAALGKDLAQVSELLASAPAPRMPDHLVTRLENALAAEAAARTAKQGLAGQDPGAAGAADGAGRRPRRRSWQLRPVTLGVAAAIAAILAVGGYGLANLHQGVTSSSAAGRNAHRPAGTVEPNAGKGVTSGGLAEPSAAGRLRVIDSGTDYLPGHLTSQAQAVLASHPINASMRPQAPLAAPDRTSQLPSCVRLVTGGLSPLLVDEARYQGRPATIIVLAPTAGRAGQVWVTGPTCSATSHNLLAHTWFTG
jgi:hypothetical protein